MSVLNLTFKHGKTLAEAQAQVEAAVRDVQAQFGMMVQRVDWTPDRQAVKLAGTGFVVEMRVDAQEIHVEGDLLLLGRLLGSPVVAGLKGIVERTFQKRLTDDKR